MNNEKKLLSKAVLEKNLTPLFMRNVNANWFADEDDKRVWTKVRDHFSKYGECPSLEILKTTTQRTSLFKLKTVLIIY